MYLNDGDINREVVKSKYGSIKRFLEQLTTAHNMVADVIVNNKIISTSIATFSVNSGYVLANIDARFALTKQIDFNAININIRPANSSEDVITSYTDNLTEGIPANDVDADLWFKVGSLYPFNSLKLDLPASYFNSMRSENMPKIDFSKLRSVVTEGDATEESGNTDNTGNNSGTGDNPGAGDNPGESGTTYTVSWELSESFTLTPVDPYESDVHNEITIEDGGTFKFTVVGINGYEVTSVYAGENEPLTPDGNNEYSVTVNNNITITVEVD